MVRQNIGLKISLIIFVFLTIVLAIGMWLYYDKMREFDGIAKAATQRQQDAIKEKDTAISEFAEALTLFGCPPGTTLDQTKVFHVEHMEAYGKGLKTNDQSFEDLTYFEILPHLQATILEKTAELAQSQIDLAKSNSRYDGREASHNNMLAKMDEQVRLLAGNYNQTRADYTTAAGVHAGQITSVQGALRTAQERSRAQIGDLTSRLNDTNATLIDKARENDILRKLEEAKRQETFESPDGLITNVNADGSYVWIDLGSADGLRTGVSFSVYDRNMANMSSTSAGKGTIEITKIEGEHQALGRVKDSNFTDPILRGDIIHTPLWSRGEVRRFALTGYIDIDGDGRSDLDEVRRLIAMNRAQVDAYLGDDGEREGKMSYETRYLVLGRTPDHRSPENFRSNYTRMIDRADELGIQTKTLTDLLREMGYRHKTRIIDYSRGGNAATLRTTTSGDGVQRVSTGNTAFQNRRPPRPSGGGAY